MATRCNLLTRTVKIDVIVNLTGVLAERPAEVLAGAGAGVVPNPVHARRAVLTCIAHTVVNVWPTKQLHNHDIRYTD